jgi:hypothetical protein
LLRFDVAKSMPVGCWQAISTDAFKAC